MVSGILLTKLLQPHSSTRHIQRQHLIQRLNAGFAAGNAVTLVSAPAGSGKTTCVSTWIDELGEPVTWLSLDSHDDEPERFFTYLIAALQQVDENLGWEIGASLRSGQLPPGEIIYTTLINDILQVEQRFVLVLDDFQVIQERFILDVFEKLVTNLPQSLHLVLITREDPALPLARLRANNQLTEIRVADLYFTQDETAHFLNTTMALSLSESDIALLKDKTEGWVVGLQLAALAMQQHQHDPSHFIAELSGNHYHILNYLTEEVLNQQPEVIQRFLLETSILDRLNGDLCDAITGHSDSHTLLDRLSNANLFLFPLDEARRWYRYHHLFADLLRDLRTVRYRDETADLHRRASHWYAQAGMVNEAIQHALAADDRALTVDLIETHVMDMLMQWHVKTVENWLQALPVEWRSLRINLASSCLYLFHGDFAQAFVYLDLATAQPADEDPSLQAEWLALQSMFLNAQGQTTESLRLIEQALDIVPEHDATVRSLIYMGQTGAYQQMGDYARTVAAYHNIIAYGRAASSLVSELLGISGLVLMALHHGQFHMAFEMASQGAESIERAGVLPPISTGLYGELGQVYFAWHQLEQAHHYFRRSIQVCVLTGYSDAEIYYAVIQSRLHLREGNLQAAAESLQQAVDLMQTSPPAAVREELIAQQVQVYLAQDRAADAERVLKGDGFAFVGGLSAPDLSAIQRGGHPLGLLYNSALRIILYRAQVNGETALLQQGIDLATGLINATLQRHYHPIATETLLLRAQMHATAGNHQASGDDMIHALTLAEPEDYISVFIEEGQPTAAMLASLLDQHPAIPVQPAFIQQILSAFDTTQQPQRAALVEPLTGRELDVLRLMAEGLKYQEIADGLFISLNTVRFYVKEIYSKLNVNNRTQALEYARRHNLI